MKVATTGLTGVSQTQMGSECVDVRWELKAGAASIRAPDPLFMGGASTRASLDKHFSGRTLVTRESGCLVFKDAYAYDCGLVIKDDKILLDRLFTIDSSEIGAWGFFINVQRREDGRYDIANPIIRRERLERAVLVLKRSDYVHGHWLLEALPKAHLGMIMAGLDPETRFIVSADAPSYQVEMLVALGISGSAIVRLARNEVIECGELWVPSLAHTNELWLHPSANAAYDTLVEAVRDARDTQPPDRVFVTRSSRGNDPRPLYNISEVEEVAVNRGCYLLDPGTVHWREQIRIFSSGRHIVGLCGSGLHNTLFTGSNAHVCTLQQNQNTNYMQSSIAAIRDHNVSYLTGETLSAFDSSTWNAGFLIDCAALDYFLRYMA